MYKVIAVDGPANAGKSTLARLLAKKLEYNHLDSGALYRTFTYYGLMKLGPDFSNRITLINKYFVDHPHSLSLNWSEGSFQLSLLGKTLEDEIRSEQIDKNVHAIASNPDSRQLINKMILRAAARNNMVAEGRDIGTVVFPKASKKFFLTASPAVRAKRRLEQLNIPSSKDELDRLLKDITERDHLDANRVIAPLKPAADAILIDGSDLSPEEVLSKVLSHL